MPNAQHTSPMVFVTQLSTRRSGENWVPSVDITPAEAHGELTYIIPPGVNFPDAAMALDQIRAKLDEFKTGDFLLPMGDPVVMAAAAAVLGARREAFQMLKWDRHTHSYHIIIFEPIQKG